MPAVNPKPRSSGPALHVTACALLAAGNEILPFVFLSSLRGDEGSNNLCHTSTRMLNTRQTFTGKYSYSHSRVQQCKRTGLLHNVRFMPCCDTQLLHAEKPKFVFQNNHLAAIKSQAPQALRWGSASSVVPSSRSMDREQRPLVPTETVEFIFRSRDQNYLRWKLAQTWGLAPSTLLRGVRGTFPDLLHKQ